MSYCRIGNDSDVYVYNNEIHVKWNYRELIEELGGSCTSSIKCESSQDMMEWLNVLAGNGLKVPTRAIERLKIEQHNGIW